MNILWVSGIQHKVKLWDFVDMVLISEVYSNVAED
jgi:hypothetical protein